MVIYFSWYTCLVMMIPTVQGKLLFHVLCHVVAGLIHVQITLSHFASDTYWGNGYLRHDDTSDISMASKHARIEIEPVPMKRTSSEEQLLKLEESRSPAPAPCSPQASRSQSPAPSESMHQDVFIRQQFMSTLNISCPASLDWFHGGLQFQIEHHLIPRLPRHHLRRAMVSFFGALILFSPSLPVLRPILSSHSLASTTSRITAHHSPKRIYWST